MHRRTKTRIREATTALSGAVVRAAKGGDLAYIKKNLSKLSEYDLEDLERKLKEKDLRDRLDISIDRHGKVYNTNIKVDLLDPIEKIVKQVEKAIGKDYGDLDFRAYKRYVMLMKDYYFRHVKKDTYQISLYHYPLSALVDFLLYITTGKVESDRSKAIALMDEQGIKGDSPGTWELPGVKVKVFKNGRVDLKFDSAADADKARETTTQWNKQHEADRKSASGW